METLSHSRIEEILLQGPADRWPRLRNDRRSAARASSAATSEFGSSGPLSQAGPPRNLDGDNHRWLHDFLYLSRNFVSPGHLLSEIVRSQGQRQMEGAT
jgi:hypothetical protein